MVGISLLSFGAGVFFARSENDLGVITKTTTSRPQYGGPDELRAAIKALKHIFGDRLGLVSTDASDAGAHARWFTGRKAG